ncbi:MAG: DUF1269 domain-containing protein [Chloroflexaceae bacterium]|nr:DUF1269 domain-containing protein [Chloroflexaceae bacterium]NJO05403.1 DUF1269 domain-containing protein [Chloroflexaceae bacterium]
MSDLIAISFSDQHRANEVLNVLRRLEHEYLIDLDDAVVVVRNKRGNLRFHQTLDLTAAGAAGGTLWGLLLGMVFGLPFVGALAGAAGGAISGHYADLGIKDDFITAVSSRLGPGTSAIFLLVRKVTLEKVLPELGAYEGVILHSSLAHDAEEKLAATIHHAEMLNRQRATQADEG